MSDSIDGFLLTRQFRDTREGLELGFWAATDGLPLWLRYPQQEAVCFTPRTANVPARAGIRRKPLELLSMEGEPVDALYARTWRSLSELSSTGASLLESDVKPHDRFLMERYVRAGVTAYGEVIEHESYLEMINPRLKPWQQQECQQQEPDPQDSGRGDHAQERRPQLIRLALDIETRGSSRELYSIAGAVAGGDARVFMVGTDADQVRDGYLLHFGHDERTILDAFFAWVAEVDPDVLTGWSVVGFDLAFLDNKCKSLGMRFAMGRGPELASVFQGGNQRHTGPRIARIPGRAVLDGIDLLKAAFYSFESFSLENVAREFLGVGKLIAPKADKVGEINRLFREDKPQLADYNLRDCTLVNEILDKADLVSFAVARASLTGLALDRLAGATAAFDNLYLPALHRAGRVAPNVNTDAAGVASPGGYVMDSLPGLYKNVLVLDFKSLYPSIIRTFFVDPLALAVSDEDTRSVPGFIEARFHRERHILPGLITSLWAARDAAKAARNAPLSTAIKIIMNSFYGVLGTTACRFHDARLASSITRRGHEIITGTRDWVEAQGYRVIYGDTDSVFVLVGDGVPDNEADSVGQKLAQGIDEHWQRDLRERFELRSHLEVEFETRYARFFMPTVRGMPTGSKKRYAGLVQEPGKEAQLVVKGLEAVRTDWTPLAREFQRELLRRVFLDLPVESYVIDTRDAVLSGEYDDKLVYRKRLRRGLGDYQRNVPPHVQAARKLARPGNTIRYVITVNGPEPAEAQESAIDHEHYLERQLAPAADGVLQFLGTSFSAMTDAQLGLF